MKFFDELLLNLLPKDFSEKFEVSKKHSPFVRAKDFNVLLFRQRVSEYKINFCSLDLSFVDFTCGSLGKIDTKMLNSCKGFQEYIAAAELNGYQSYTVTKDAFMVTLISSLFLEECFSEKDDDLFFYCLCAINLLAYLFYFKIKVAKDPRKKENYNWYFDFFIKMYFKIVKKIVPKCPDKHLEELRNNLVMQYPVFSFIFDFYYHISFMVSDFSYDENEPLFVGIGNWISDEDNFEAFFTRKNYSLLGTVPEFSDLEEFMLGKVGPSLNLLVRDLFSWVKMKTFVQTFVKTIFDKQKIGQAFEERKFLNEIEKKEQFLQLIDVAPLKEHFFDASREYFSSVFMEDMDSDEEKQFEEFQEQLEKTNGDIDKIKKMKIKIPKRIREESYLFDQFLDFYLAFFWENSLSTTDSGYLRLMYPRVLRTFFEYIEVQKEFYGDNIHKYFDYLMNIVNKNSDFYYRLQLKMLWYTKKVQLKNVGFDSFIRYQFIVKSLSCLVQEILPRENFIFSNPKLLDWFKNSYGKQIGKFLHAKDFVALYLSSVLPKISSRSKVFGSLKTMFNEKEISSLKNGLYSLSFWIYLSFREIFSLQDVNCEFFALMELSELRKTLFGILLFAVFLHQHNCLEEYRPFFETYFDRFHPFLVGDTQKWQHLLQLMQKFEEPLSYFLELEENQNFCAFLQKILTKFWDQDLSEVFEWMKTIYEKMGYFNAKLVIPV